MLWFILGNSSLLLLTILSIPIILFFYCFFMSYYSLAEGEGSTFSYLFFLKFTNFLVSSDAPLLFILVAYTLYSIILWIWYCICWDHYPYCRYTSFTIANQNLFDTMALWGVYSMSSYWSGFMFRGFRRTFRTLLWLYFYPFKFFCRTRHTLEFCVCFHTSSMIFTNF